MRTRQSPLNDWSEFICLCGASRKAGFTYDSKINFFVCGACLKIAPTAFFNNFLLDCYGCDHEYIIKRHPDLYELCDKCGG